MSYGLRVILEGDINGASVKSHTIAADRLTKRAISTPHGAKGAAGANGSAVAYAHVLANGTIDLAHSKNVSASISPAPGRYCLKVAVPVSTVSATVDAQDGQDAFASGAVGWVNGNAISYVCPYGYNALIVVANSSGHVSYPTFSVFN